MRYQIAINTDILANLMPNIWTIITQLLATLILFLVLKKLVWKPVKAIMDKRAVYEQERLEKAEQLRADNEKMNAQIQQELQQANKKASETIKQAQQEGNKVKEALISEGKEKAQALMNEAQQNIALAKSKMVEEMHQEIVDVAISAAEKMLQSKLDEKSDRDMVDKFVKEITK